MKKGLRWRDLAVLDLLAMILAALLLPSPLRFSSMMCRISRPGRLVVSATRPGAPGVAMAIRTFCLGGVVQTTVVMQLFERSMLST